MRRKKLYLQLVHEFPHQLFSPSSNDEAFRPWLDRLKGDRPLVIEIGTGTGDFLVAQAEKHPDMFFLGVEVKPDRIYKSFAKADKKQLKNIAFLQTTARRLKEFDPPKAIKIILLFSDPWPKERHILRRLTSPLFLPLYEDLLVPGGALIVKTDHKSLFDYSITTLQSRHWKIIEQEHGYQSVPEDQTQYEKRFISENKQIFYLRAQSPTTAEKIVSP